MTERNEQHRRISRPHIALLSGGVVLIVAGFANLTSSDTLGLMAVVAPIVMVVGIRRYRPSPQWPWWAMFTTLVLFMVAGILRLHFQTLGNLTRTRSLVPDIIDLPGYIALDAGLVGFLIARTKATRGHLGVVYDAIIAGLAMFACSWVYLIEPVLSRHNAPVDIRFILVCYPAMSLFCVVITLNFAFGLDRKRTVSERFFLFAMFFVFVGDALTMLGEIHFLAPTGTILNVPYIIAYTAVIGWVLDPSMQRIGAPSVATRTTWSGTRIGLIAIAFTIPALLVLQSRNYPIDERFALFGIISALTGTAILQIIQVLRTVQSSEKQLKAQALHDTLTGLPNRRFLEEFLASEYSGRRRGQKDVAILFLDLDRFKLINDTLGHTHGDELLVQVSQRLRNAADPRDLVTRIGGDEFVIVLGQNLDINSAREFANLLRTALRAPIIIDNTPFFVTVSIGLAYEPVVDGEVDTDLLLRDADTAMYQAKAAGRDAVAVFDDSMRAQLAERVEVELDLRHAVERGELHLVYQPIVSMRNHDVLGLEALVRWVHPHLGVLMPTRFIPLAEESDLINEIGTWVLGEALHQLAITRAQPGLESLTIAVNLSAIQLRDELVVQRVGRMLAFHRLPGSALCLELTESAMMSNSEAARVAFAGLRRLGVKLAIDDFGTEYSSLAYLQRLPVDILKIDRSFVEPLSKDDSSSETLIAAIVAMAQALEVETVAEGIETTEQAERLVSLGCDAAQGYLFARPVRADQLADVIELLSQRGPRPATGVDLATIGAN